MKNGKENTTPDVRAMLTFWVTDHQHLWLVPNYTGNLNNFPGIVM